MPLLTAINAHRYATGGTVAASPSSLVSQQLLTQVASPASAGIADITVYIGDEAIDPHMVKVTDRVIDKWLPGAQHVATAAAAPAIKALSSPHADAVRRRG